MRTGIFQADVATPAKLNVIWTEKTCPPLALVMGHDKKEMYLNTGILHPLYKMVHYKMVL